MKVVSVSVCFLEFGTPTVTLKVPHVCYQFGVADSILH